MIDRKSLCRKYFSRRTLCNVAVSWNQFLRFCFRKFMPLDLWSQRGNDQFCGFADSSLGDNKSFPVYPTSAGSVAHRVVSAECWENEYDDFYWFHLLAQFARQTPGDGIINNNSTSSELKLLIIHVFCSAAAAPSERGFLHGSHSWIFDWLHFNLNSFLHHLMSYTRHIRRTLYSVSGERTNGLPPGIIINLHSLLNFATSRRWEGGFQLANVAALAVGFLIFFRFPVPLALPTPRL